MTSILSSLLSSKFKPLHILTTQGPAKRVFRVMDTPTTILDVFNTELPRGLAQAFLQWQQEAEYAF